MGLFIFEFPPPDPEVDPRPPDVPGAPDAPTISDITSASMTLTWSPPEDDGGSPITAYILESKDKYSSRFTEITKDSFAELTFTVKNLKENNEYSFRVIAENKAGKSEPSREIRVTAKFDFGKLYMLSLNS